MNAKTTYTVSQTFSIFGDPSEQTFSTEAEAEAYASELADGIAESFWTRDGDNATCTREEAYGGDGLGSSNEVEWSKNLDWNDDNDGEESEYDTMTMPWSNLVSACSDAVEITRSVVICDEEIEGEDNQNIALALIDAIDAGNDRVRFNTAGDKLLVCNTPAVLDESEAALRQFQSASLKYPCIFERNLARERVIQNRKNELYAETTKNNAEIIGVEREIKTMNDRLNALQNERSAAVVEYERKLAFTDYPHMFGEKLS